MGKKNENYVSPADRTENERETQRETDLMNVEEWAREQGAEIEYIINDIDHAIQDKRKYDRNLRVGLVAISTPMIALLAEILINPQSFEAKELLFLYTLASLLVMIATTIPISENKRKRRKNRMLIRESLKEAGLELPFTVLRDGEYGFVDMAQTISAAYHKTQHDITTVNGVTVHELETVIEIEPEVKHRRRK